jgi:hypothetical protein
MREPYVEGSSDPPRPRVMAACPQGCAVSVDRGTRRAGIELRNQPLRGADLGNRPAKHIWLAVALPAKTRPCRKEMRHCQGQEASDKSGVGVEVGMGGRDQWLLQGRLAREGTRSP